MKRKTIWGWDYGADWGYCEGHQLLKVTVIRTGISRWVVAKGFIDFSTPKWIDVSRP